MPGTNQKGAKSQLKSRYDYQKLIAVFLKKVPSSEQKGARLLAKRRGYLDSILPITSSAVSHEKLMQFLIYENMRGCAVHK